MHKKALTVAIAGALAAPMAAQAMDFSVSGRVSRALVITDSDVAPEGTKGQVKNWGSSGSRFRFSGSDELMDGMTAGGKLEYDAQTLSLRYGEVWYSGSFGKMSIGLGDEGGEGSVYSDKSGVSGIGHGQEKGSIKYGDYFGSLDGGGGRNERVRYDTPSIGPVSAAISVGNGDEVSAGIKLSQSFGDTAFGAKIGTTQSPGDNGTVSASAGISLPAGVTVSGAWGTEEIAGASNPSFFQATVGYKMGDATSFGVSWYASSDFENKGSEGTAIGIGVTHNLPKGVSVTAAVQNYAVEDKDGAGGAIDSNETVAMLATVIKF